MTDAKSAKLGKITMGASDFAHVRNWKLNLTANVKKYATSTTAGHEATTKGAFGGTVSFDLVLDHDDRIEDRIKVGDQVTLLLYTDETKYYSVPCRISSMDNEVQIEEGEPPTIAVEADCHGAWTYPDGTLSAG
jgi:hypothetical protein